ncbi:MAG: phenylalanine--tRNA ligase subunit beta [Ruminococcus sp.]|jgi:phenylalanyl-tRNA synthetase beta chain|nr:phenylalanine--tRNA ligase subunit beta [Ruminococcus sp.]
MNLSMNWLSDFVQINTDIKTFVSTLTLSGSKVEGYGSVADKIQNVVVGKILSIEKHPDSDHLVVCQVDVGAASSGGEDKNGTVQIVTGASNVNVDDFVPAALHGSLLPNGVKIKKTKMRGVESAGMLCSLSELGLTAQDFPYSITDGIFIIQEPDIKPGQDIASAVGLDDTTVEFEITSNRPDCLSVIGLARETAASFNLPFDVPNPSFKGINENINDLLKIDIINKERCPRYCGGLVKNVKIKPSPRWMRERLRASGVRPINNLVDITNYVMLEYGQPMHAFDIRYVDESQIIIRNAAPGEKIVTLDGTERKLDDDNLCICDKNKPIAVAGVMGGEFSGIMDDTTTVVFESAYFEPVALRKSAKKLGMRTDASSRYEKGIDPQMAKAALYRAFELVEELGAGEPLSTIIDVDYTEKTQSQLDFNPKWINDFLGCEISDNQMIKYLTKLGFTVENNVIKIPSYRIDIESKADIAEEVARLYGYNNFKSTELSGASTGILTDEQKFTRFTESICVGLGLSQIETFSFISPKYFDRINLPQDSVLRNTVTISNPLGEDTSVMRTTIIPSMLEILSKNYKNRNDAAALFEIGKEYLPKGDGELPDEVLRLCIGMYGSDDVNFYSLKGIIEEILNKCGIKDAEFVRPSDCEGVFPESVAFHPGRSAVVNLSVRTEGNQFKTEKIAIFGEIHPSVLENYGIDKKAYAAKILIPELSVFSDFELTVKPLPKYPAITRDLSLVCDEETPVAELEKLIKSRCGKSLEKLELFDIYRSDKLGENKKSVSYSFIFRSDTETLTDEKVFGTMNKILTALKKAGIELRG